jgi:hypothetical protein
MKDKAYLYHIYCKVKTGSKEKNKSYNQIKMCTCMDMVDGDGIWMEGVYGLLLYDTISLLFLFLLDMGYLLPFFLFYSFFIML